MKQLLPVIISAFLGMASLLTACAPRMSEISLLPAGATDWQGTKGDFANPPDVIVMTFSGRCGIFCNVPVDSWDSLRIRGTTAMLTKALVAQGLRVSVASYTDYVGGRHFSRYASAWGAGYSSAVHDLNVMKPLFATPRSPKLVVVGYSHGTVWAHLLVRSHPEIPVALQIDLDGVCGGWHFDHDPSFWALPQDADWRLKAAIEACEPTRVRGRWMSPKDIVWPNVAQHLEVRSKNWPHATGDAGGYEYNFLFDRVRNSRPDGSREGLQEFISFRDDHSRLQYINSDAVKWLTEKIAEWGRGLGREPRVE